MGAAKWSDYIDYWAVDWNPLNDIFTQGWAAYRTRKEKKLPLASGSHAYEKAGTHSVLVRVIDIFGNETRQAFAVEFSSRSGALPPVALPRDKSAEA